MRADYIERFHDRWHGGLRRLADEGAWFTGAAYPYAETETCPGHATISTGVFPAKSGIVENTWYDRRISAVVTCTHDAAARNIGLNSRAASGDSAAQLLVPSLAEEIRAAIPGSRSVTMSLKARSAVMLAGRQADAVLWSDEGSGALFTSSAYGAALPAFAARFAEENPLAAEFARVWTLSAPESTYAAGGTGAGANPPAGWTTSFPHAVPIAGATADAATVARWRASPFADAWLERLAEAAIDGMRLGKSGGTDFLGISFSATDYIGHAFGPDSREIEDQMLRLDQTIGALLKKLDRAAGAGRYVVALTADHGVAAIPEQARARGRDAGRADAGRVAARINAAIAERLGAGRYVAQIIGSDLYLAPGVGQRAGSDPVLWQGIETAALGEAGVQRVVRRNAAADLSGADALERALAYDFYPGRSGELWISLKRNWIFSAGGTTHGSENDYDQRVPLIFFGQGIKPVYSSSGLVTLHSFRGDAPRSRNCCGVR